MSLFSMTGYGRNRQDTEYGAVDVEIRTVNHRYVDLVVRIPRDIQGIEDRIKSLITGKISRGRVNVNIALDPGADQYSRVSIDEEILKNYLKALEELKCFYKVSGEIDLRLISGCPEIFTHTVPSIDEEKFWLTLEPILSGALTDCVNMREREGERIGKAIVDRLTAVEALLKDVEQLVPERIDRIRERLRKAVFSVAEGTDIEESRLLYEVSLVSERWDITEEFDRINSHISLFRTYIGEGGVLGRRLTFLCQELHREANTISSKANDSQIVQKVVLVKEEIEKIREQLENLE